MLAVLAEGLAESLGELRAAEGPARSPGWSGPTSGSSPPRIAEGFDLLYRVRIGVGEEAEVEVEEWAGEPETPPPI